jgi:hypothetical protein
MPTTSQVIARRIGRIAFGGVLFAGVAYLSAASLPWWERLWGNGPFGGNAARIIMTTWVLAALAGLAARFLAARVAWSKRPDWLFAESMMVPAAAIPLLFPITLHMPVALLLSDSEGFNDWVALSVWITGLPHAVLAITSALRARQLVAGKRAWSPARIYAATVIASCLPFVVLYAIPPVLVAITGLACMPLLYAMERIVARERAELAQLPHELPRAIAVSR